MRLSMINNEDRQFRGETSPSTLKDNRKAMEDLIDNISSGNYQGRYFTWNNPKAAAAYSGGKYLIECDIDRDHLVSETGNMAILDRFIAGDEELEYDIENQKKYGVPAKLTNLYIKAVNDINNNPNSFGNNIIKHADGWIPKKYVPLAVEISKYTYDNQVMLIDRPLLLKELKGVYILDDMIVSEVMYNNKASFEKGHKI